LGDFSPPKHVIHARRRGPCTIAHRRIVLKQDVRPQPMSKIHFGNILEFRLHTFGQYFTTHGNSYEPAYLKCDLKCPQPVSIRKLGTPSTRHTEAGCRRVGHPRGVHSVPLVRCRLTTRSRTGHLGVTGTSRSASDYVICPSPSRSSLEQRVQEAYTSRGSVSK
jgi:hypothetical protein